AREKSLGALAYLSAPVEPGSNGPRHLTNLQRLAQVGRLNCTAKPNDTLLEIPDRLAFLLNELDTSAVGLKRIAQSGVSRQVTRGRLALLHDPRVDRLDLSERLGDRQLSHCQLPMINTCVL